VVNSIDVLILSYLACGGCMYLSGKHCNWH